MQYSLHGSGMVSASKKVGTSRSSAGRVCPGRQVDGDGRRGQVVGVVRAPEALEAFLLQQEWVRAVVQRYECDQLRRRSYPLLRRRAGGPAVRVFGGASRRLQVRVLRLVGSRTLLLVVGLLHIALARPMVVRPAPRRRHVFLYAVGVQQWIDECMMYLPPS